MRIVGPVGRVILIALLVLAPAVLRSSSGAQTVRGTVVSATGREPVNGGIVALIDETGRVVSATLADDSGHYTVHAPVAGRYRLRVERVGYRSTLTAPFPLADGESRDYPLAVGGEAVTLAAVKVTADKHCIVRPGAGVAAAELWNEARKALDATRLAVLERSYAVRLRKKTRTLDPETLAERDTRSVEEVGHTASPFVSVPGDTLARYGFARREPDGSMSFFAPDADVLLSDLFLDSHCLMAVPLANGLAGLVFEPASARKLPDVKGVLWFDPRTAELRFMQYQYVNLALDAPTEKLGGRIDFVRLPNGRWIVRRWYIRMPELAREQYRSNVTSGALQERVVLAAIRETGGEVLEIDSDAARAARNAGAISGTVFDSIRSAPVAGARVFVSGTAHAAVTDAAGRYRIDSIAPGAHLLSMVLPRLDSLLAVPPSTKVALSAGAQFTNHFAVPSLATLARTRCGLTELPDESAMLVGIVRDSITGKPAGGVVVRAEWQHIGGGTSTHLEVKNVTVEAETSGRGRYALCALPLDRPVTVHVVRGKLASGARAVRFDRADAARLDLLAPAGAP